MVDFVNQYSKENTSKRKENEMSEKANVGGSKYVPEEHDWTKDNECHDEDEKDCGHGLSMKANIAFILT